MYKCLILTSYFHVEQTKIVLLLVPYCPSLRMIAVGNSICFSYRKLEDGDIVNVDVTVYYKGVHGEVSFVLYDA